MITGIIMASGFSKRMKTNKLTLRVDGVSILERVLRAVKQGKIEELIMTYREKEIQELGERYGIKTLYNHHAHIGQSEAIKLAVNASDTSTQGFAFFVGDQPFLLSDVIITLVEAFYEDQSRIVIPLYGGERGNPVIFPSEFRGQLLKLKGDDGGRKIIEVLEEKVTFVHFKDAYLGYDVDTWDRYKQIKGME